MGGSSSLLLFRDVQILNGLSFLFIDFRKEEERERERETDRQTGRHCFVVLLTDAFIG